MAIFDFSEYQGTIDFGKVRSNTDLLILRVQAGSTHPDTHYAQYVAGCKANNVPFGTYAYARYISVADAQQEAKDCFARMDKSSKFVVVDVESVSTTVATQLASATQAFIDYLHSQGVSKVGLYSGESFYSSHGLSAVKADFLWIAKYGTNDGQMHTKPTMACDLWQYSSTATESGVVGHVDIDALNGGKPLSYFTGVESTVTGTTKQTIFLPASNDTWTVYKMGHPCSKSNPANIAGELAPKRFGGLTYDIKGTTAPDCYIIHTDSFGDVQIYGAPYPLTDAIIKTVVVAPPAPPTPPPAPAPQPAPVPFTGLQNGSMATIKTTATNYASGEVIADDVKGKPFKVVGHTDNVRSYSKIAYQLDTIPHEVLEQDIVESGVSNGSPYPPPAPQVVPVPTPVVAPVVEPTPQPVASAPVEAPKPVEQPKPTPVVVAPIPTPAVVEIPVIPSANTSVINIAPVSGNSVNVGSLAKQIEDAVMKDPQLQKNFAQKVLDFFVSLFK